MTEATYRVIETDKGLIKAWTQGVPVEAKAEAQLCNVASLPFIHKHVAVMPDVHFGKGATVGSVIPTHKAIIPGSRRGRYRLRDDGGADLADGVRPARQPA